MKYKHNKRMRIIEEVLTVVVISVVIAGIVFFLLIKPYLDNVIEDLRAETWQLVDNQTLNPIIEPVEPYRASEWQVVASSEAVTAGEVLQHAQGVRYYQPGITLTYIDNN